MPFALTFAVPPITTLTGSPAFAPLSTTPNGNTFDADCVLTCPTFVVPDNWTTVKSAMSAALRRLPLGPVWTRYPKALPFAAGAVPWA